MPSSYVCTYMCVCASSKGVVVFRSQLKIKIVFKLKLSSLLRLFQKKHLFQKEHPKQT